MTDLKPCPFCGGKPYLVNAAMPGCAYVVCTDCRSQGDDGSQYRAIAAWNSRATPPEVAELVEALRDASAYLHGSNPLNVAGGHRNHDLREKLGATLAKWEGKA